MGMEASFAEVVERGGASGASVIWRAVAAIELADLANAGRRPVRQDDPGELGLTTAALSCQAIDEGRYEEAKALVTYTLDPVLIGVGGV